MSKLKVVSVGELRTAKDGRQFYTVGMRGGFGQRVVYRNFFEQYKRDPQGNLTDEKYWERGSREEAIELLRSGELVEGEKVTKIVEEYAIPGSARPVNTYSTVVFPDENVETVFDNQNHPIVDESTGQILSKRRERMKAVLASGDGPEEEEEEEDSGDQTKADLLSKN